MIWRPLVPNKRLELHAAPDPRTRLIDASYLTDRSMYVTCTCRASLHGLWEVSYWKLEPPDEGEDPLMCGDWVDLPMVQTLEDAKLIAENIVRLNMGGWP